jgi:hypothetical protein
MKKAKSSLSKAKSYSEIGRYWDAHDLSDFWKDTKKTAFDIDIESEITYYAVDKKLSDAIQIIANKRGIAADTLINLWVQEKLKGQHA